MKIRRYYNYNKDEKVPTLTTLLGETCKSVENLNNEYLVFTLTDGRRFVLYHDQNCCESVEIEDITGDLSDLVGEPILLAEEVVNEGNPKKYTTKGFDGKDYNYEDESSTWTFYKFATRKGYVDIRWYGTSNGYYSERVDFGEVIEENT